MSEVAQVELPRYRSHKEVWALKIQKVEIDVNGMGFIIPTNSKYAPISVFSAYLTKHDPQAGGYYVVYEDGYQSWSPAEAFEKGYTLIDG